MLSTTPLIVNLYKYQLLPKAVIPQGRYYNTQLSDGETEVQRSPRALPNLPQLVRCRAQTRAQGTYLLALVASAALIHTVNIL